MTTHYERRGAIAVLQIDNPPVNGLGHATRQAVAEGLQQAASDRRVRAIVITGTGTVFSGGADIREFNTPASLAEPILLQLIERIEQASKPVVAAINGICMGGGTELSLACHYRIATPDASIGLPEVKIGLLPGAGGTQRLPRAIGVEKALQMIVSGDPIGAKEALQLGLVERIVDRTSFDETLSFAEEIAGRGERPRLRDRTAKLPVGTSLEQFLAGERALVAQKYSDMPAPARCIDAVEAAATLPFDEGLALERRGFIELLHSKESKALRYAFFAERAASKIPDLADRTPTRPIRKAAIVGFGTMGTGIAMAFANAGIPVGVLDQDQAALARGLASCRANWEATARKGRLASDDVERRLQLLSPTTDFAALAEVDLVIEAAFEDAAVKRKVLAQLDARLKKGAIIATNTSTLDVNQLAAATSRPADVIGLHFFSPAQVMRLLEIVRGERTADDVLATALQLARRLKKVAVVARVCDGFIGNRMLEQYVRQSLFLVDEGAAPQKIDAALKRFGMAMGPFAMFDMAGMDIGYAIRQRRYREKPEVRYSRIADRVVERGRLGQKSGKGWYRYEKNSRVPQPDDEIDALIDRYREEVGINPRAIADDEIVHRCIYALVNEGARLLEEGIALRASDIDVVYLNGYGFPRVRGGPMYHAQAVGFEEVIATMQTFADNEHADPAFWQPAPWLQRAAELGRWPDHVSER